MMLPAATGADSGVPHCAGSAVLFVQLYATGLRNAVLNLMSLTVPSAAMRAMISGSIE